MKRKLTINDLALEKPDLSHSDIKRPKDKIVCDWLIQAVELGVENKRFSIGDFIPTKDEIAQYIGASTGTVQNAIRYGEDLGYFKSRQGAGTSIRDFYHRERVVPKMYTKRDITIEEIKKIISKCELNQPIPTAKVLGEQIGTSPNTVRLALDYLIESGYLKRLIVRGRVVLLLVKDVNYTDRDYCVSGNVVNANLVKILTAKIRKTLKENFKPGDKITTNTQLSRQYKVSLRTINLVMANLYKENVVISRRGHYGTIYLGEPTKENEKRKQKSEFMTSPVNSAKYIEEYQWKIVLKKLKNYISKNFEAGDKLPSYIEMAKQFNTSANTIRKAVITFAEQDILFTKRGKNGGTFINNLPQNEEESYTWLALNPNYINQPQN